MLSCEIAVHVYLDCWEAVREVAGRPPPIGGHCMVRFDSHRAVMYGGTTGNTVLDSLYIVDLETRVGGFLMQCTVCICVILRTTPVHLCLLDDMECPTYNYIVAT